MNRSALIVGLIAWAGCVLAATAQEASPIISVSPAATASSSSGAIDAATAADRFAAAHPGAQFYQTNGYISRVYGAAFGGGSDPLATAETFRQQDAGLFGVPADDLMPVSPLPDGRHTQPLMYDPQTDTYKFTLVYYSQYRGGVPVFRADVRLLVRNEAGYPLVWAGSTLRPLGTFQPDFTRIAAVDPAQAAPDMTHLTPAQWVIWAGIEDQVLDPVLAWTFEADNEDSGLDPQKWLFVVDAATGSVLYRENLIVSTDVSGQVHGMATTLPKAAECNPEADTAMPYAKVTIGTTTAYANAAGSFIIPNSGTTPVTVTSYMSGQYFNVVEQSATPLETLTTTVTPPGPANFMHNSANTGEAVRAQVNAYVEANRVRDFVLTCNPAYPTIATQNGFPLNVNIASTCNAYYNGTSLNFYLAGGGCSNTAFAVVVHHEYGHHVVACAGSGQGEYGEGLGDCLGALITNDPVLAYGFQGDCNAGLRDADNTCQYSASGCSSCGNEIHACGQLISGIVWSIRSNLMAGHPADYRAMIANLTVNSVLLHTGTSINGQIAIDFLTLDDDDANIGNGTPHRTEICDGFSAHGIACPALEVGLKVAPATDFSSDGPVDGPFTPSSIVYTLYNQGPNPLIAYDVAATVPWLTVTNSSGTVAPGTPVTVTVAVNGNADSLTDGDYFGTITFTNTTDHEGDQIRQATLGVGHNDLCTSAKPACPGVVYTGTTAGATVDGSAWCSYPYQAADVWYKYTPALSGTATFSLCPDSGGTYYDSVLSLHSGCPGTTNNSLACDNDGCGSYGPSKIQNFSVTGGTTYLIRISGYYGATGPYALLVTGPACPTPEPQLYLTPGGGLSAVGNIGGVFTPDSITYTLTNTGLASMDYTVSNTQNWVSASSTGGTLAGLASTTVTVSINSNANSLPAGTYTNTVTFTNATNHEGDATRPVSLQVGVPGLIYSWDLDTNPGWTISGGQWAWGVPAGLSGDPAAGHTRTNVYGYNLSGNYASSIPEYYLTTTPISCLNLTQVTAKFWRWLGVEQAAYDHARFQVSNNGTAWTTVWENPSGVGNNINESAWSQQSYDISAVASHQATVYLRWVMGPTDSYTVNYCGWNIDDVEIWGLRDGAPTDVVAPTPNPMTFASPPAPISTSDIAMTATTATDSASPPVSYFFTFASGGSGGTSSNWQPATTCTDTGLAANTVYAYTVKARDSAATPNETVASGTAATATYIETPTGVSFGALTTNTIDLNATGTLTNLTTGSSGVYFDSTTTGGDGGINAWLQITADTATGLSPNTSYTFQVKARNQNSIETAYSPTNATATAIQTPTGVTIGAVTTSTIDLSATGTLTNLDSGMSGVYFGATTTGGDGGINDWVQTMSDQATGLAANTRYFFQAKARNQNGIETAYSPTSAGTTLIETPTGVSFGTVTDHSIALSATGTLTNLSVGSSGVYFDSTTPGGDGGINAWLQMTTDSANGLSPNTSYTFQVKARNQGGVETAYGPTATKVTLATVPAAPTLADPATTTMTLNVNPGANPAATVLAVRCTATSPTDAAWLNKYVSAAGSAGGTAVWQTDGAWGVITITGLQPNTTYTFAAKARNSENVETAFGPGASLATTAAGQTGACCYDSAPCAVVTQAACTASGGVYQGDNTTCALHACCLLMGDLNADGTVNGADIQGFVNAMLTGFDPCADLAAPYRALDMADVAAFVSQLLGS